MSHFSNEVIDDVVVETVNLQRATITEADEFKSVLFNDIEKGKKKIVVDFSQCEFIDSSFLGSLVIAYKETGKAGGALKIAGVHSDAEVILEITGTSKIFEQYQNKNEAVKSFKGRA
jgi:anti-anti-sigma factor